MPAEPSSGAGAAKEEESRERERERSRESKAINGASVKNLKRRKEDCFCFLNKKKKDGGCPHRKGALLKDQVAKLRPVARHIAEAPGALLPHVGRR